MVRKEYEGTAMAMVSKYSCVYVPGVRVRCAALLTDALVFDLNSIWGSHLDNIGGGKLDRAQIDVAIDIIAMLMAILGSNFFFGGIGRDHSCG